MEEAALAHVLSRCVEALDAGESLDEVLRRYPALSDELRPLLETALRLHEGRGGATLPAFPDESLRRRLREAGAIP